MEQQSHRNWVIYKISSPSGRIYIGKTQHYKKRLYQYKNAGNSGNGSSHCINKSLNKYGFENHKFEVIDDFTSDGCYCCGKEIFWIRSYMSNLNKWPNGNGLNLTNGGEGMTGFIFSDESRKKMSEAQKANPNNWMKGKKHSEESKHKQSLAKLGKPAHNKGMPMPKHQIELLRLINTGRPAWNKGKKFQGTEEERKLKFGAHNLGNLYNKGKKHTPEVIAARVARQTGRPNVSLYKPVIQYTLNGEFIKEFVSLKSASEQLGVNFKRITRVIHGSVPKKDFFYFKYKQ